MNRRRFLLGSVLLAGSAAMGVELRKSWANAESIVDEALNGAYLKSVDDVERMSRLSYAFANIRIFYNRPFGYENTDTFKQHVFDWLSGSFYGSESNTAGQTALVNEYLKVVRKKLEREMGQRLERNVEGYDEFLHSIGIEVDRHRNGDFFLSRDFLQAQAVFAVFAGITRFHSMSSSEQSEAFQSDGGLLGFFDNFTGIWPFCENPS